MTCTYTYQGKSYSATEFDDVLRSMSPSVAAEFMPGVLGVPNAPFVTDTKSWVELGIKQAIRLAIDSGVDGIVFGTGQQNADLYDLSKQADSVNVGMRPDGTYSITAKGVNGQIGTYTATKETLPEVVGKDLAEKIVREVAADKQNVTYSGLDLKVGGSGMRTFYDHIVPSVANEVLRKFGVGKVATVNTEGGKQIGFQITPEMRAKVEASGVPLFARGNRTGGIALDDLNAVVNGFRKAAQTMPSVHVLADTKDATREVQKWLRENDAMNDAAGLFYNGEIYLFASHIRDTGHAQETFLHEAQHYGLSGIFGDALEEHMLNIYKRNGGMKVKVDARRAKEPALSVVEATNEVLADMAGNGTAKQMNGWDRLVGAVREILRRAGWAKDISDNDVQYLIYRAGLYSQRAKKPGYASVEKGMLQRVQHGTPHILPHEPGFPHGGPRLDKIGTGISGSPEIAGYKNGDFYDDYALEAREFNELPESFRIAEGARIQGRALSPSMEMQIGWRSVSVIANGVARDFSKSGVSKLVGSKVENSHDLAAVAQIYRDPRLETARYFFVKDGAIVGQTAISSRKPGSTQVLIGGTEVQQSAHLTDIIDQMGRVGADTVWILHNHPDGNPTPSQQDIDTTATLAAKFMQAGKKFGGHVIINQNRFATVSVARNGSKLKLLPSVEVADFGRATKYDIANPKLAHPLLNEQILSPIDLAHAAKKAQVSPGQIVIVGVSGSSGIRVIAEVTPSQMSERRQAAILRHIAKQTGSDQLFAYGVSPEQFVDVQAAIRSGLLVDAIVVSGAFEYSTVGYTGDRASTGYSLGTKEAGYVVSMPTWTNRGGSRQAPLQGIPPKPPMAPPIQPTANLQGGSPRSRANTPIAETTAQKRLRVIQNKFNRFKVLQKWIEDQGIAIPEEADVYLYETTMPGRIAARMQDFRELQMKPLIEKTVAAGIEMEQIDTFLKAQHAPEANVRARVLHNDKDKTAYGMTDQESKSIMASLGSLPNFAELKRLANEWRSVTTQSRDILLNSGIIPADLVKSWEDTYSLYIPVKGDEQKTGTGRGLSVAGRQHRRLGHGARDEAIIENIWRDHERAITNDEKNLVGKALVRFALEIANPEIITVGKPVKRQVLAPGATAYMVTYQGHDLDAFDTQDDAKRYVDQQSAHPDRNRPDFVIVKTQDPVRVMLRASPMLEENEVNVYLGGYAVRVQINDEIAARAYKNIGVEHLNAVLSAGREANNWLSKAYTGYSPDFIFTNPIRDAIQGSLTLTGEYGAFIAAKIFMRYPHAVKELFKHFRKRGSSALVSEYRADGGSTGAAYLSDLERIGTNIRASYNEYAGMMDTYGRTYKKEIDAGKSETKARSIAAFRAGMAGFKEIPVIGHFLKLMEHINSITENALRVATYEVLVPIVGRKRAAAQAKNLMNFNRKGEISNQAGAAYLFFNPSIQGTEVMYHALSESPHKRQAQALAGVMVLAAIALAELARGSDEDKWKRLPIHVKDGNWVIGIGDYQFTFPLPYGYRLFHTLGNVIDDYAHGVDGTKLGIRLASAMFDNLSPIGNPFEGEHGLFQLVPTIPKMILGPGVNENSFGGRITPMQYSDSKPDSQLMYRTTKGTLYDDIASTMNQATGGSKYEKGVIDVSPETLKFWVTSLTGGTGKFVLDTANIAKLAAYGELSDEPRDYPIVHRFVRSPGISDSRTAFYEAAKDAKKYADEFANAKNNNDVEAAKEINNPKMRALSAYAEKVQEVIKSKRDEQDRIKNDDSLTLQMKQIKMKAVEIEENAVYDRFLKQFESEQ